MVASNHLIGPAKARSQKCQWLDLLSKNVSEKVFSETLSDSSLPVSVSVRVKVCFRVGGNYP